MSNISISNLEHNDTESLLVSLETEDSALVKAAVQRALDARKIIGGTGTSQITLPDKICFGNRCIPVFGMIATIPLGDPGSLV